MLEIDGLCKKYGDITALRNVTFDVRPGEILGFVGSNGAGKSTTMRIALGVLTADSGEVRLDGRPIDFATRKTIGYMPEERGLYPKMKVADQLAFLAELHGMTRKEAFLSMERWTDRLGLEDKRGRDVQELSLGNQQRVQLAAALVHDPVVLVLDEPFSGLDPVAVDVMSEVLREKARLGAPVVFSSHQLDLVERLCDRVGIIVRGEMRAIGSVEELRARGKRQLAVSAPNAPTMWAEQIPGVRLLSSNGNAVTLLELEDHVDDQSVLEAALAHGPVRHFAAHRPTLTELFREVVSE
ncbi:ABC transporter ATP-binding protein [Hoyosella altamirensis]|uniref:ABC-2 type transport system ATP-binding protein n=1 Tax=Hoyosella altamirensis TaxID=616997 RepID=A0A839RNV5_9ACTN|nr:ATP-binding cassette domain-containing protein [Hoyosella altamirensis]MBB3038190.1 ABC-2 type transport system ATP-binding protein [Hoyosella altamirensis]